MTQLPLPLLTDEASFGRLVAAARHMVCPAEEVARLASHLARSGESLAWSAEPAVADLASTGGPGSLSTLLAPLLLRCHGCRVVKLSVPGRPAGAIDALGTVPGYRMQLSPDEVRRLVETVGFAHFIADETFAPLDASLFSYRRRVGAMAVPALVAASLLSKKVAVGVRQVGLDVRVGPHGNFGATLGAARAAAGLFCAAARVLGIEAVAFLSADRGPAQPWIGRGEGLLALAAVMGAIKLDQPSSWLTMHAARCRRMAEETAGSAEAVDDSVRSAQMREVLAAHLDAQGTSWQAFLARVDSVATAPRRVLEADACGVLSLDLAVVRDALVALQRDVGSQFRDPAGLELLVRPGRCVTSGQPLARIRCTVEGMPDAALLARLRSAFRVIDGSPAKGEQHLQHTTTRAAPLEPENELEIIRA